MSAKAIRAYGVDGCRGGWFYFWIEGGCWGHGLALRLDELVPDPRRTLRDGAAERIVLVDIPIGLRDVPGPRGCDVEARKLLARRAASVFSAPSRAALAAASYEEACEVNARCTGRRLSRQCWGIVPKIREVDELLRLNRRARACLRESHPELCFAALNGGEPMAASKKTVAGASERLAVLGAHWSGAAKAADAARGDYRRAEVGRDDILDAMVLTITAALPPRRRETVPAKPQRDDCGLPMEMVRPVPSGSHPVLLATDQ